MKNNNGMESLTKSQAAAYLQTTKEQVSRWVAAGCLKQNRQGKIDKAELDQFLTEQAKKCENILKNGWVRGVHDLTLEHFVPWLWIELAAPLSGLLVGKGVSEKDNLDICRNLYSFMLSLLSEYHTRDCLNKVLTEAGGGFDAIHYAVTGEKIKSKPSDLTLHLPDIYLDLLTKEERAKFEKMSHI